MIELSLNVMKTHRVLFIRKRKLSLASLLELKEKVVVISKAKFMGVFINLKLNWKSHVKHVENKLSESFVMLVKAKSLICKKPLVTLYDSLIFPYFAYREHIWCNTYWYNFKTRHV